MKVDLKKTYTPHGYLQASLLHQHRLAYQGELLEGHSETYLLGNGYRLYCPVLMRFLAPDSWSPFGKGGVNAYAYCSGDPINNVDPDGHAAFNRLRRPAVVAIPDAPPPQTAQHLNRSLNRQRLQSGDNSQPRIRNPLANGGRMPFEDRRNPSVALDEVVEMANELMGARRALASAPENLNHVHAPKMLKDYLASIEKLRREVPVHEVRLNEAMVKWFHS